MKKTWQRRVLISVELMDRIPPNVLTTHHLCGEDRDERTVCRDWTNICLSFALRRMTLAGSIHYHPRYCERDVQMVGAPRGTLCDDGFKVAGKSVMMVQRGVFHALRWLCLPFVYPQDVFVASNGLREVSKSVKGSSPDGGRLGDARESDSPDDGSGLVSGV